MLIMVVCIIIDLQLAALLGKTLLEKNGDLEIKLKRLEEFAGETVVGNQVSTCNIFNYIYN